MQNKKISKYIDSFPLILTADSTYTQTHISLCPDKDIVKRFHKQAYSNIKKFIYIYRMVDNKIQLYNAVQLVEVTCIGPFK